MTTGLLITTAGRNAIIADLGGGADLVLTHVAWGDANGVPYNPNEAQVALVNEKYRATIASVAVVGGAIVVDAVIPADTNDGSGRPSHGFSVAEVGLFSSAGTLIGVARCGNGYKPPPSSGQAHDVTYRLKLAVANPSAITVVIDPAAQVSVGRQVRPFWLTVDGVLNDPPVGPVLGATYIIAPAPTGAWIGFANRVAQWVGVWALASVPVGHVVVDNSKGRYAGNRWLERTLTGWDAGLTRLVQRQPGNFINVGGTANALTGNLDPAPASYADLTGAELRVLISSANTGDVTINLNGLGPVPIVRSDGHALAAGDLVSGQMAELIGLGAGFQLAVRSAAARPGQRRQIFEASGNFTVPAGVTQVNAKVWPGGGSSAASSGIGNYTNGAGAGGYSEGYVDVLPGQTIPVTVGAGGVRQPAGGGGQNGGTSSFGSYITVPGGDGANATPGDGANGSAGAGGDINLTGGQGKGATGGASAGDGGNAPLGGQGGPGGQSVATDGRLPGGGAAGAGGGSLGGNGGAGLVIVEW